MAKGFPWRRRDAGVVHRLPPPAPNRDAVEQWADLTAAFDGIRQRVRKGATSAEDALAELGGALGSALCTACPIARLAPYHVRAQPEPAPPGPGVREVAAEQRALARLEQASVARRPPGGSPGKL